MCEELRRRGPVAAYATLERRGYRVRLNLLYALQAGLMGLHWPNCRPRSATRCVRPRNAPSKRVPAISNGTRNPRRRWSGPSR
ncbi:TfoX/Sxy family DNA transformation protein [Sulfidibacter corallicola]|uniref:TfoX/Sxy family DNA transformation protein n=1 Tax=Sulfidibacter corallicola TaxID=2818388 RepID=A0A8A4TGJ6_SULCO|nr:TfoX/Sxy family DNA transformation protein [Sulfidibacter corallicola]